MPKKQSKPAPPAKKPTPKDKSSIVAMLTAKPPPKNKMQQMSDKSKHVRRMEQIGKGLCGKM